MTLLSGEKMLLIVTAVASTFLFYNDLDAHISHLWTFNYSFYGNPVMMQQLAVCVLSLIADYFVLGWHSNNCLHPKFSMVPARKFCIAAHIIGGTIEIFCMVTAFFAADPVPFAKCAAYAALLLHVPSSLYQTPIVFGVKKFMIPCYIIFSIIHATTSCQLLFDPSSTKHLLRMFIALHGYVWVRVSIFLFKTMGIFKAHEYTVAVLFAGFLNTPLILGAASNFFYLYGFVLFQFLNPYLVRWNLAPWGDDTEEYGRETVITNRKKFEEALMIVAKYSVEVERAGEIKLMRNRDLAKVSFDYWDKDNNGTLSKQEMIGLMTSIGFPREKIGAKLLFCDQDSSGNISFNEFHSQIWKVNEKSFGRPLLLDDLYYFLDFDTTKKAPHDVQARLIFEALDADNSGTLCIEEIGDVLISWGLPLSEAATYIQLHEKHGNDEIDLCEFVKCFQPMWKYAYKILEDEITLERAIVIEKVMTTKKYNTFNDKNETVGSTVIRHRV